MKAETVRQRFCLWPQKMYRYRFIPYASSVSAPSAKIANFCAFLKKTCIRPCESDSNNASVCNSLLAMRRNLSFQRSTIWLLCDFLISMNVFG
ncbi:hypothetical protein Y032_0046g1384 [Ancylostoma ceylanicum]|uniref:Uncharacterized protein n=1 Tax=Ancylostoma ceylanicum TaxID=53326 RepID=A0A016UCP9_9BILA|nr:hypothetical protein Y032_0046g1384 [Ancylostoma ceylanicum]